MKKIVLVLFCSLALMSCENSAVREGRDIYMLYLKKTAKDPNSVKVYSEKYEIDGTTVYWTLDVGGANSYGGMVRETIKIETIGKAFLKNEDGKIITRRELE